MADRDRSVFEGGSIVPEDPSWAMSVMLAVEADHEDLCSIAQMFFEQDRAAAAFVVSGLEDEDDVVRVVNIKSVETGFVVIVDGEPVGEFMRDSGDEAVSAISRRLLK